MKASSTSVANFFSQFVRFTGIFCLSYLFLYMFPFPLSDIPGIGDLLAYITDAVEVITLWIGHDWLGLDSLEKIQMTGSGDTTFDYVSLITILCLSFLLSAVLYALTFWRNITDNVYTFVYTYARYYLSIYLIGYGFAKFNEGQFIFPGISQLESTYGDSSPMGLLWTFMGYSKAYCIFSGIGEVLGGVLLLFRRTTTLGALVSLAVMTNVVMLNFAYDVPVKLFSSHLALLSIFILFPNISALFRIFFLQQPGHLHIPSIQLPSARMRYMRIGIKSLVIIALLPGTIIFMLSGGEEYEKNPLEGAYSTTLFVSNGDTLDAVATDSLRWNKLILEDEYAEVVYMNHKRLYYDIRVDTSLHNIRLTSFEDSTINYTLHYTLQPDSLYHMTGKMDSDSLSIVFSRKTMQDYLLVNRGFHWISEYPYNR